LDLGRQQDFSALAVVEVTAGPDPLRPDVMVWQHVCRHLLRWPLGTPYPRIVNDVCNLFSRPPLQGRQLAVDQTGVGVAVVDWFRIAGIQARLMPTLITSGNAVSAAPDGLHIAKVQLVSRLVAVIESSRLRVADGLPYRAELQRELEVFQMKVTKAANLAFEAEAGEHDDLGIALALAVYLAEQLSLTTEGMLAVSMQPHQRSLWGEQAGTFGGRRVGSELWDTSAFKPTSHRVRQATANYVCHAVGWSRVFQVEK
jgi:hypothetical protein